MDSYNVDRGTGHDFHYPPFEFLTSHLARPLIAVINNHAANRQQKTRNRTLSIPCSMRGWPEVGLSRSNSSPSQQPHAPKHPTCSLTRLRSPARRMEPLTTAQPSRHALHSTLHYTTTRHTTLPRAQCRRLTIRSRRGRVLTESHSLGSSRMSMGPPGQTEQTLSPRPSAGRKRSCKAQGTSRVALQGEGRLTQ